MLAEWYSEQRLQDSRAYKFIITQYAKDPPEPGALFPFLADVHKHSKISDEDELDRDEFIFHQVTATLTAQTK